MEYPSIQELQPDGRIFFRPSMNILEAVLIPGPYKTAHAPCLLELSDGTLLCAWFAGTFEGGTDINIIVSRLEPGSGAWSEPVEISKDPDRSDQNPSLFRAPGGEVWAMYTSQRGRVEGKDNMQFTSQIRLQRSADGGKSWSAFETIFPEEGTFARQPIQILADGRWIYGNWICRESADGLAGDPSAFRLSDDAGKSWKFVEMPDSKGCVHPNVVELAPGHLVAFMRSRKADFIYRSESTDNGSSWTRPLPTVLPNNNSSISAVKLASGRLAIAYNPTSAPEMAKDKVAWPGLRCPVAVALSEDGGRTFPLIRHMEAGEGYAGMENRSNNSQYEYPFLMQTKDGFIHLAFAYRDRISIKWMRFREEDVCGKKRGFSTYNPTSGEIDGRKVY